MDRIIEEAGSVYRKYGSEDLGYVAEKLGAEIHEDLRAENAREVYFPDLQAILLRPGLPAHERRYLIAHALGHHLFHRTGVNAASISFKDDAACGILRGRRAEVSPTEREADVFAAYLLVAPVRLRQILEQEWVDDSEDPVLKLALEFQVSVELMNERLILKGLRR